MAYYRMASMNRGDYYRPRGDYYRGDPGIFGFFGKLLGAAASVIPGVGPIAGGILSQVTSGLGRSAPATPAFGVAPGARPLIGGPVGTQVQVGPSLMQLNVQRGFSGTPGGLAFGSMGGGGGGGVVGTIRPRRTHKNKVTYVTRGGGTSRWGPAGNLMLHPAGSEDVTNRRMNVANPRALRRAIRRLAGFGKLVHRARRGAARLHSSLGLRSGRGKRGGSRAPSVRIVKAA